MNFLICRTEFTSEGEWVSHEDLFHGCFALGLTSFIIVAAGAPTVNVTVPIVLKTFTIELQTP